MLRGLTKAVAYARMPKATFALLHPRKALKWGLAFYLGKLLLDRFRTERRPASAESAAGAPDDASAGAAVPVVPTHGSSVQQPFPGSPPTH